MQLRCLEATNFLSLGSVKLDIPTSGLVLLAGWNEDTQRANGAGKSSLFQVICWCLYGKFPRDIKVDEIVRRGSKACEVKVQFLDRNGRDVLVCRSRPTKLSLSIDGVPQEVASKDLQAKIETLVGLSYEQYLITSYFPQNGSSSRFIKQTDSTAKDFLASVLSLDKIDSSFEKAKAKVRALESEMTSCEAQERTLASTLTSMTELLKAPLPSGPDAARVQWCKSRLEELKASLLVPVDTSEVDALITRIADKRTTVQKARSQLAVTDDLIKRLSVSRASRTAHQECPHCAGSVMVVSGRVQEFDAEAHETALKEEEDTRLRELAIKEAYATKLREAVSKGAAYEEEYATLLRRKAQSGDILAPLKEEKASIEAELRGMIALAQSRKQAEQSRAGLQAQIDSLTAQAKAIAEKSTSLATDLLLWSAVKSVFAPTGFVAYSLDGIIEDINAAACGYLDILSQGTMSYALRSVTDDGKAKICHTVSVDGEPVSLGSLSGGEERCVVFAVDMAIADTLVRRANAQLPSMLMMDECLEGLDSVGKEKVLDSLKDLSRDRCIVVIDHSTEFSALFDQTLRVVKRDKISSLEVL